MTVGRRRKVKQLAVLIATSRRRRRHALAPARYIDVDRSLVGARHGRHEIIGDDDDLLAWGRPVAAVFGIGWPARIAAAHAKLAGATHLSFPTLVHPTTVVDASVELGEPRSSAPESFSPRM